MSLGDEQSGIAQTRVINTVQSSDLYASDEYITTLWIDGKEADSHHIYTLIISITLVKVSYLTCLFAVRSTTSKAWRYF